MRPLVFIVNDDGYAADGIQTLARAVAAFADVVVCAPATNQSAQSFSISLGVPLTFDSHDVVGSAFPFHLFSLSGSPVDCVIFAMHELPSRLPPELAGRTPDLLISGINHGANLGGDVLVSGTVAAAVYATLHYSIPSISVSVVHKAATSQPIVGPHGTVKEVLNFEPAAAFVASLARRLLAKVQTQPFLKDTTFNVNVPNTSPEEPAPSEFEVAVGGVVNYLGDTFVKRGDKLYLAGTPAFADLPGSDCNAIVKGRIAVTPLAVRAAHYPTPAEEEAKEEEQDKDGEGEETKTKEGGERKILPIKRANLIQPTALMCPVAVTWATSALSTVGGLSQVCGHTVAHVASFHRPLASSAGTSEGSLTGGQSASRGSGWGRMIVAVAVAAAVGFGVGRMSVKR